MKRLTKGFTMIELLIVIAVLGILAVAVLAAINPIEQINRGKDTGSQSDAEQLIGAIDRFYAAQGYYPWMTETEGATCSDAVPLSGGAMVDFDTLDDSGCPLPGCTALDKLGSDQTACTTASNEVKTSFVTRISDTDYNDLMIYNRGNQGDSYYICFLPQSGSFEADATTRCTNGLPADLDPIDSVVCPGTAGDNLYCLP